MPLLLAFIFLIIATPPTQAQSFIAYGDMPYNLLERWSMNKWRKAVVKDDAPFVINIGDLGRPEVACTDEWLFTTRQYWATFQKPVFYTPGDNDWTDCDRKHLPQPSSELDRLTRLRQIMYPAPPPLSKNWDYQQQANHPENQRWQFNNILFTTLHIVGTANGRNEILQDNPELAQKNVDQREQANLMWLNESAELAKQNNAKALILAFQANVNINNCLEHPIHRAFCQRIKQLAEELTIPILLIHGDTAAYCLDQVWGKSNLWRINLPGDGYKSDLVKITFDEQNVQYPFSAKGLITKANAATSCT